MKGGDICRGENFSSIDDYHASVFGIAVARKSPGHAERTCKIQSDVTKRLVELIRHRPSLREIYEAYLKMIAKLELLPICPFAVFENPTRAQNSDHKESLRFGYQIGQTGAKK